MMPEQNNSHFSNDIFKFTFWNETVFWFKSQWTLFLMHYGDVILGAMASQITSLTIVHSIVYSGADQRKHQSSASLAFVRGIHRWPVNFPHKGPVTWKMFPFDDVIMGPIFNKPAFGPIWPRCVMQFGVISHNEFIDMNDKRLFIA